MVVCSTVGSGKGVRDNAGDAGLPAPGCWWSPAVKWPVVARWPTP
jgi:hypothetical protein